jgi:purine-binding chemotaxis protein CheW
MQIMSETAQGMEAIKKDRKEGKYLTFSLGKEEYGIGIQKIKEIIGLMTITPIPKTPEYYKGVINLRGKVIPVVDLRLRFGMASIEHTDRTCIIVVEVTGRSGNVVIGILVDAVSEVVNIRAQDIDEPPSFGKRVNTDFILGMGKMEEGVKILLDIDRVLSEEEIEALEKTTDEE